MKDFNKIKLLVCDCDGVLTDGLIIYDSQGTEIKNFSAHDGLGIKILNQTEIQTAVITGRYSKMLEQRCEDLNIKHLYQHAHNKKRVLSELLTKLGLEFDNVAYIGDDWNDFLAMQACHLKIAPNNARDNFKMTVDYVTDNVGGYGAVRDAIEYILKNRKEFEQALESFFEELEKY
jgi:3-deoxy-D-manno-octulosonate 8-phosphate phosphatase (KDO 8-P phosphatase)